MSVKCAAQIAQVSQDQTEGIFWRNAAKALGIKEDEGPANEPREHFLQADLAP